WGCFVLLHTLYFGNLQNIKSAPFFSLCRVERKRRRRRSRGRRRVNLCMLAEPKTKKNMISLNQLPAVQLNKMNLQLCVTH
ncbi:unnamed protein product, partial [Gadus morhua 'NCC']